jgi:uncharacterized membrane-anchored protein YhcB (DUF1043 family)
MTFFTGVFIIILAGMAVGAITEVAKAIAKRGGAATDLADLKQQLEQNAEELANQSAQIAELQERIDFTERLLAQARERGSLKGMV